jgi:hypothetical protein
MNRNTQIVEAEIADIPVLVSHHRRMFIEISDVEPSSIDLEAMELEYQKKLYRELKTANFCAWVVKFGNEVVASCSINS